MNEDLRQRIADADELRLRLDAELDLWGTLCTKIREWSEKGHALEAEVNETAKVIRANLDRWDENRAILLERLDADINEADWGKE